MTTQFFPNIVDKRQIKHKSIRNLVKKDNANSKFHPLPGKLKGNEIIAARKAPAKKRTYRSVTQDNGTRSYRYKVFLFFILFYHHLCQYSCFYYSIIGFTWQQQSSYFICFESKVLVAWYI